MHSERLLNVAEILQHEKHLLTALPITPETDMNWKKKKYVLKAASLIFIIIFY